MVFCLSAAGGSGVVSCLSAGGSGVVFCLSAGGGSGVVFCLSTGGSGVVFCLSAAGGGGVGKNVPLRHERPRWKSDHPLTEKQVRCKRDEFWDTAPAFDGRSVT